MNLIQDIIAESQSCGPLFLTAFSICILHESYHAWPEQIRRASFEV